MASAAVAELHRGEAGGVAAGEVEVGLGGGTGEAVVAAAAGAVAVGGELVGEGGLDLALEGGRRGRAWAWAPSPCGVKGAAAGVLPSVAGDQGGAAVGAQPGVGLEPHAELLAPATVPERRVAADAEELAGRRLAVVRVERDQALGAVLSHPGCIGPGERFLSKRSETSRARRGDHQARLCFAPTEVG